MQFEYKKNKILTDLIIATLLSLAFILLSVILFISIIRNGTEHEFKKVIFSIVGIIAFLQFSYVLQMPAIIRYKYYCQNRKEEIILDDENQRVIIREVQKKNETILKFSDIHAVELYYSWNTNPWTSDLGYSKLIVNNRKKPLIITQNKIDQYEIFRLFKNRITINKSKFMNDIKYG